MIFIKGGWTRDYMCSQFWNFSDYLRSLVLNYFNTCILLKCEVSNTRYQVLCYLCVVNQTCAKILWNWQIFWTRLRIFHGLDSISICDPYILEKGIFAVNQQHRRLQWLYFSMTIQQKLHIEHMLDSIMASCYIFLLLCYYLHLQQLWQSNIWYNPKFSNSYVQIQARLNPQHPPVFGFEPVVVQSYFDFSGKWYVIEKHLDSTAFCYGFTININYEHCD